MNGPEWPGEPEPTASPLPEDRRPEPAALGPAPWEDPERPRLAGYFQTLREVLRRPALFFARPAGGGPGEPFAFGLITGTTGGLLGLFWWTLLLLSTSHGLRSAVELPRCDFLPGAAGVLTVGMALIPLAILIKLALASLCLWAAAALLGARAGWAPLWRLCCYATAAAALAVVPFLGSLLAVPLALFILHQGLRGALGMSGGRALGTLAIFLCLQTLVAAALLGGGFLALLSLGLLFWG
ncbi:MAG: hypothetical protein NTW80_04015 [Deltaproteobacteria bacterium]|nr:hypothetical protein [Deltaproteobacteria bacterium]